MRKVLFYALMMLLLVTSLSAQTTQVDFDSSIIGSPSFIRNDAIGGITPYVAGSNTFMRFSNYNGTTALDSNPATFDYTNLGFLADYRYAFFNGITPGENNNFVNFNMEFATNRRNNVTSDANFAVFYRWDTDTKSGYLLEIDRLGYISVQKYVDGISSSYIYESDTALPGYSRFSNRQHVLKLIANGSAFSLNVGTSTPFTWTDNSTFNVNNSKIGFAYQRLQSQPLNNLDMDYFKISLLELNLFATISNGNNVNLSWNSIPGADQYIITYGATTITVPNNETSQTILNLNNGNYSFVITAVQGVNNTPMVTSSAVVKSIPANDVTEVSWIRLYENSFRNATLFWKAPESGTPSGYNIYRDNNTTPVNATPILPSQEVNGEFAYKLLNLNNDSPYNYHVVALYNNNLDQSKRNTAVLLVPSVAAPAPLNFVYTQNDVEREDGLYTYTVNATWDTECISDNLKFWMNRSDNPTDNIAVTTTVPAITITAERVESGFTLTKIRTYQYSGKIVEQSPAKISLGIFTQYDLGATPTAPNYSTPPTYCFDGQDKREVILHSFNHVANVTVEKTAETPANNEWTNTISFFAPISETNSTPVSYQIWRQDKVVIPEIHGRDAAPFVQITTVSAIQNQSVETEYTYDDLNVNPGTYVYKVVAMYTDDTLPANNASISNDTALTPAVIYEEIVCPANVFVQPANVASVVSNAVANDPDYTSTPYEGKSSYSVYLSWDNSKYADGYIVEARTTTNGAWTVVPNPVSPNGTPLAYSVNDTKWEVTYNKVPSADYQYRVTATYNGITETLPTNVSTPSAIQNVYCNQLNAVTELTATMTGMSTTPSKNTVTITFNTPFMLNGTTKYSGYTTTHLKGFKIESKTTGNWSEVVALYTGTITAGSVTYVTSGSAISKDELYRVTPVYASDPTLVAPSEESSPAVYWSELVNVTGVSLTSITYVDAVNPTPENYTIRLSWTAPSGLNFNDDAFSGYNVYKTTTGAVYVKHNNTLISKDSTAYNFTVIPEDEVVKDYKIVAVYNNTFEATGEVKTLTSEDFVRNPKPSNFIAYNEVVTTNATKTPAQETRLRDKVTLKWEEPIIEIINREVKAYVITVGSKDLSMPAVDDIVLDPTNAIPPTAKSQNIVTTNAAFTVEDGVFTYTFEISNYDYQNYNIYARYVNKDYQVDNDESDLAEAAPKTLWALITPENFRLDIETIYNPIQDPNKAFMHFGSEVSNTAFLRWQIPTNVNDGITGFYVKGRYYPLTTPSGVDIEPDFITKAQAIMFNEDRDPSYQNYTIPVLQEFGVKYEYQVQAVYFVEEDLVPAYECVSLYTDTVSGTIYRQNAPTPVSLFAYGRTLEIELIPPVLAELHNAPTKNRTAIETRILKEYQVGIRYETPEEEGKNRFELDNEAVDGDYTYNYVSHEAYENNVIIPTTSSIKVESFKVTVPVSHKGLGRQYYVRAAYTTEAQIPSKKATKGSVGTDEIYSDWVAIGSPVDISYFDVVWYGNGQQHMNFFLHDFDLRENQIVPQKGIENTTPVAISVGDEVGVFQGDKCVGTTVITEELKTAHANKTPIKIVTSLKDEFIDGFEVTRLQNPVTIKFYDYEVKTENNALAAGTVYTEEQYDKGFFSPLFTDFFKFNNEVINNNTGNLIVQFDPNTTAHFNIIHDEYKQTINLTRGWNIVSFNVDYMQNLPLATFLDNLEYEQMLYFDDSNTTLQDYNSSKIKKIVDNSGTVIDWDPININWLHRGNQIDSDYLNGYWQDNGYWQPASPSAIWIEDMQYVNSPKIQEFQVNTGYRVYVNQNCSFELLGDNIRRFTTQSAIELPVTQAGWYLMSVPYFENQPIDHFFGNNLNKVVRILSQNGQLWENPSNITPAKNNMNAVQEFEVLTAGQGYYVYVNSAFTGGKHTYIRPIVEIPSVKVTNPIIVQNATPIHFQKVWTGNGTSHFNLVVKIDDYFVENMVQGSEIALFDGDVCVGSTVYTNQTEYLTIKASMKDEFANGFVPGNTFTIKAWNANTESEFITPEYTILNGNDTFNAFSKTSVSIVNFLGAPDANVVPIKTAINAIYPNPFNPTTTIKFSSAVAGNVNVEVYNVKGQKVTTLAKGFHAAGNHSVTWTGIDANGKKVGSGVYFTRLTTPDKTVVKKMVLIK